MTTSARAEPRARTGSAWPGAAVTVTWEWILLSNLISLLFRLGRLGRGCRARRRGPRRGARRRIRRLPDGDAGTDPRHPRRPRFSAGRWPCSCRDTRSSIDVQARGMALLVRASLLAAEGDSAAAAAVASEGVDALKSHRAHRTSATASAFSSTPASRWTIPPRSRKVSPVRVRRDSRHRRCGRTSRACPPGLPPTPASQEGAAGLQGRGGALSPGTRTPSGSP